MARLIWGIGQYVQSNNDINPFQWSAQIGISIFETEKSHYKSGESNVKWQRVVTPPTVTTLICTYAPLSAGCTV